MDQDPTTHPTTAAEARPPSAGTRRTGPRLSDLQRRIVIAALLVVAVAGLFLTGRAAVTGTSGTEDLPDEVDQLIPGREAEVLRQAQVGIDVADGYDAWLEINGVDIRTAEDGLIKDLGTGLIVYQPAPGLPVEELEPLRNCVVAHVFDRVDGESSAQPVSWCFEAT